MLGDPVIVYYIPYLGKKTVDNILKQWDNEDRKDEIFWYAKYGGNGKDGSKERNNQYTYDQFVNSDFEHLAWLGRRFGPTGSNQLGVNPDKALYSACTCSNCKKQSRNTSVQ